MRERQPFVRPFDEFLTTRSDVCVFRQSELLLHDGRLRFVNEHGRLPQRDDHHLSTYGSARIAELFAKCCGAALSPQ